MGGGNLRCLHREGTVASRCYVDATAAWRPLCLYSCSYHVQFFSCAYSSLHTCANTVWKKGKFNGYCNECWLSGSEKQEEEKKKKKGNAGESWEEQKRVCLDARVSLGFMRRNDLGGKHDYFFPSAFSSYTGESSATRRQGAPSTRIIRRFFTSDKQAIWLSLGLFEENMFLHRTPGSPTSGKK